MSLDNRLLAVSCWACWIDHLFLSIGIVASPLVSIYSYISLINLYLRLNFNSWIKVKPIIFTLKRCKLYTVIRSILWIKVLSNDVNINSNIVINWSILSAIVIFADEIQAIFCLRISKRRSFTIKALILTDLQLLLFFLWNIITNVRAIKNLCWIFSFILVARFVSWDLGYYIIVRVNIFYMAV